MAGRHLTEDVRNERGDPRSRGDRPATRGQVGQDIASLLLTTARHCEDRLHKAAALVTLGAVATLAPEHGVP